MCNIISTMEFTSISRQELIDINVLIINNYSYNLKRNISYWSKRDPKYANILSTKNHNICTKTQYDDLVYHANIIKQNNIFMYNKDICLALLMAFYNISLCEDEDYINYTKLLKKSIDKNTVQNLYKQICGISIVSYKDDYWSDDENNDLNNIVLNDLSIECDNEIYKNVRKYMISGN